MNALIRLHLALASLHIAAAWWLLALMAQRDPKRQRLEQWKREQVKA